jgi:uncharacterized protein (UPF0276 family)
MEESTQGKFSEHPIPSKTGIGLRAQHYSEVLSTRPSVGWLEVHSENYFAEGGPPPYYLEQIRAHYPISLHGVGLSIGSSDPLSRYHLNKLKMLINRYDPLLVSEHLSWSSTAGRYVNDLLPLPYTEQALRHMIQKVSQVQEYLGRQILIENVSSYLQFNVSTIAEWEFIAAVATASGCGILLDVNNIYVNAVNHGFDPLQYLQGIPREAVKEIHLAGFDYGEKCLIDTHGKPVAPPVWDLYRHAVRRFGRVPTLIEWDTDIPPLSVLLQEAAKADSLLEQIDDFAA